MLSFAFVSEGFKITENVVGMPTAVIGGGEGSTDVGDISWVTPLYRHGWSPVPWEQLFTPGRPSSKVKGL